MFFGRYSRIFRSRWAALLWAAGIVWTAIEVVGVDTTHARPDAQSNSAFIDATGAPVTDQDIAVLKNFIGE